MRKVVRLKNKIRNQKRVERIAKQQRKANNK